MNNISVNCSEGNSSFILHIEQLRTAKHPTSLRFYNYHHRNSEEFAEMQVAEYWNIIWPSVTNFLLY